MVQLKSIIKIFDEHEAVKLLEKYNMNADWKSKAKAYVKLIFNSF